MVLDRLTTFQKLVERSDHKPFVRQFHSSGSQSVGVADLDYPSPVVVHRTIEEFVLAVQRRPVTLEVEMGGDRRRARSYAIGEFDLTPASTNWTALRDGPSSAIAISIPGKVIKGALDGLAPNFSFDFGRLHAEPWASPMISTLCTRILDEAACDSRLGPLYSDTLVQALIQELYRLGGEAGADTPGHRHVLPLAAIEQINEYIDQYSVARVELKDLATLCGLPTSTFSRMFKKTTGMTPYQYVLNRRVTKAKALVQTTGLALSQIAYKCGFSSQSHMTDVFKAKVGVPPGHLRRR